jgi:hypothetical protein
MYCSRWTNWAPLNGAVHWLLEEIEDLEYSEDSEDSEDNECEDQDLPEKILTSQLAF